MKMNELPAYVYNNELISLSSDLDKLFLQKQNNNILLHRRYKLGLGGKQRGKRMYGG